MPTSSQSQMAARGKQQQSSRSTTSASPNLLSTAPDTIGECLLGCTTPHPRFECPKLPGQTKEQQQVVFSAVAAKNRQSTPQSATSTGSALVSPDPGLLHGNRYAALASTPASAQAQRPTLRTTQLESLGTPRGAKSRRGSLFSLRPGGSLPPPDDTTSAAPQGSSSDPGRDTTSDGTTWHDTTAVHGTADHTATRQQSAESSDLEYSQDTLTMKKLDEVIQLSVSFSSPLSDTTWDGSLDAVLSSIRPVVLNAGWSRRLLDILLTKVELRRQLPHNLYPLLSTVGNWQIYFISKGWVDMDDAMFTRTLASDIASRQNHGTDYSIQLRLDIRDLAVPHDWNGTDLNALVQHNIGLLDPSRSRGRISQSSRQGLPDEISIRSNVTEVYNQDDDKQRDSQAASDNAAAAYLQRRRDETKTQRRHNTTPTLRIDATNDPQTATGLESPAVSFVPPSLPPGLFNPDDADDVRNAQQFHTMMKLGGDFITRIFAHSMPSTEEFGSAIGTALASQLTFNNANGGGYQTSRRPTTPGVTFDPDLTVPTSPTAFGSYSNQRPPHIPDIDPAPYMLAQSVHGVTPRLEYIRIDLFPDEVRSRYTKHAARRPIPLATMNTRYCYEVENGDGSIREVQSCYYWHPILHQAVILPDGALLNPVVDRDTAKQCPTLQACDGPTIRRWYENMRRHMLDCSIYIPPYAQLTPENTKSIDTMITFGDTADYTLPTWFAPRRSQWSQILATHFSRYKSVPTTHSAYANIANNPDGYLALLNVVRDTHPNFNGNNILSMACPQQTSSQSVSAFVLEYQDFETVQHVFKNTSYEPAARTSVEMLLRRCNDSDFLVDRFQREYETAANRYKFEPDAIAATINDWLTQPGYKLYAGQQRKRFTSKSPHTHTSYNSAYKTVRQIEDIPAVSPDTTLAPTQLFTPSDDDVDFLQMEQLQRTVNNCVLCDGTHAPYECPKLQGCPDAIRKDIFQRFAQLRRASRPAPTARPPRTNPSLASMHQVDATSVDPDDPFGGLSPQDFQMAGSS